MPLDVLAKIQSFANGGSVDAGTKGAINQMIGDAQQNPALQSGLNGIANAVTNNGADINPDTMAKLARAGQAFSKAMEQANLAMLGIHGSFNSIDVTPLEKAEASLTGIAEHGKNISINIGTKDAESSLSSIANRLEKIRASASIGVSVSTSIPRATSAPKVQKFATGGRITYHRQNTETAQTGGIFRHGSSTGDRNMIFANRGEGIITEKAVRQGARQRGMSPESYVQALNHPSTNLARVKKGRSFAIGGVSGDAQNRIASFKSSTENYMTMTAQGAIDKAGLQSLFDKFPDFDDTNQAVKDIYGRLDNILKLMNGTVKSEDDIKNMRELLSDMLKTVEESKKASEEKAKNDELNAIKQSIEEGLKNGFKDIKMSANPADLLRTSSERKGTSSGKESRQYDKIRKTAAMADRNGMIGSTFEGMIQKSSNEGKLRGISSSADLLSKMKAGAIIDPKDLDAIEEICDGIEDMQASIQDAEDRIETFHDAWAKLTKTSSNEIKNEISGIPVIGKMFNGNVTGTMAYAAAVVYLAKKFGDLMKSSSDFVIKQAEISKSMTVASQSLNTFGGGSFQLEGLAKGLNMTREQAVQLGSAMNEVALKGVNSVNTVYEIANNLKNALGKVDTALLKEAVNLINDLPKEQVEVMIHGNGTFDDKANLIANLMNDGNLEKSINLMMNGAFGKKDGSVQLDEKDKAVIEAQERTNAILDSINKGIYSLIPKGFAATSVHYAKLIGTFGKAVASLYMLYAIHRNVQSIAMGKNAEKMGNIFDKIKDYSKDSSGNSTFKGFKDHIVKNIKDGWNKITSTFKGGFKNLKDIFKAKTGGTSVLGKTGTFGSAISAGAIVFAVSKGISAMFDNIKEKREKKRNAEYEKNREENIAKYGNSVGADNLKIKNDAIAAENASKMAKVFGYVVAAGTALAVGLGACTLGVGALVGGLVVAAGAIGAYFAGNKLDASSSFTTQEKRGWYNPMRWFGDKYDTEMDDDAPERMKNFSAMIEKMDKHAKDEGKKTGEDLLKELVTLNKHAKAIEMITKGKYTAFEENNFNADMDLLKQNANLGGTGADFAETKNRAFGANMRSYATQTNALGQQKQKIMSRADLSAEAKANLLNKVIQDETKMHMKFIDNMTRLIDTLGETPEIITSNLKQKVNDAFNDLNAGNFMDNSAMALDAARNDMKSTASNFGALLSDYNNTQKNISETMKTVEANIKKNEEQLKQFKSETGIQNGQEARDNLDRITAKMRESIGATADLTSLADMMNEAATKAADANHGDDSEKSAAAAELKGQVPKLINQLEEGLLIIGNSNDPEEKAIAAGMEAELKKLRELQAQINKGEEGEEFDQYLINTIQKMSESGTGLDRLQQKIEEGMNNLSDQDRKTFIDSRSYEAIVRAISSSKDTKVATQQARTEVAEKYVSKIKEQTEKFISSLEHVLNNGAIQFAKAMKEVFEQSEEYDLFEGQQAAFDTLNASFEEIGESLQAINDARSLLDNENGMDEINKSIEEYFAESEKQLNEAEGNLTEQAMLDNEVKMYEEICKFHEDIITNEERESVQKADSELGESLKKAAGDNFEKWSESEAKEFGFSSKDEMQGASAEFIGRKFREHEEKLIAEEKENYRKSNGTELSDEEAHKLVRKRMKDDFGDNSMSWIFNESKAEKAYETAMNANADAVGKARGVASQKRASFEASKPMTREQVHQQAVEKFGLEREQIAKERLGGEKGREYIALIRRVTEAQRQKIANPHDKNVAKAYEDAKQEQREFEKNNFDDLDEKTKNAVMGMAAAIGAQTKGAMKVAQAEAQWKQKFMQVFNSIPKLLEKVAMNSGKALVLGARQGALEAKQSTTATYGDIGKAIGMRGEVIENASELLKSRMNNLDSDEMVQQIKDAQLRAMEEARKQGASPEKLANMQMTLDNKVIQAKYEAEKKAKDEYIASLRKSMESVFEAISTKEEGLGIEKDLYETIGAPFEYILDVEQELVKAAKDKATAEEEILAQMEKDGITGLELEKQKNKVAKASAEVIKASFGAQRDALDKLLGKMMGGFEQIGGIFGPDSDFMKARKAGQGYTQLPSGMISASGGTVTDYADRVAGLQGASGMQNGVKMGRGEAVVFGNGRGIPGMANGGLFGDWIARQWKQLKEGMNNTVGNISGDTGYAVTPNGNKVRMNRKEAIFNYDTLTALARPLGETPEQYVADALSGNPYSGIRANIGYTNVGYDKIFGRGSKNRLRKHDDTTNETPEQAMVRQLNEKRASALALGMEYQYRNGNLIKKGEDRFIAAKDAIGNSIASKTVKGNAESKMNDALQNSAFGGMAENTGSAGVASSSADKLLLAILEDTHKIVEALGGEADWKKYEELANSLNKKDQKQQKSVKKEGEKDDKTDDELKKENKEIYGKRGKQNKLNAEQTARVSANNDKIAGHAYDAIAGSSRTGAGEEKSPVEQALDTDKEILQYVKLIYGVLRQGGGFGGGSVAKSSTMHSKVAETIIPKNDGNVESVPKFHAPSSVSATAIVAGINAAAKAIPKLVNVIYNIPKAVPKATAFFKGLAQKTSTLAKGATPVLSSSKAGSLAKATTAGKASNWGLNLSKWGSGLKEDFLLGKAGELYGANEKGVSLASRAANKVGNLTKNIGSKTGSRVGGLASKIKNAEWVNKVVNGVKGSTSPIANGTKQVFARGLSRAPRRALIKTLGRGGATRTLNAVGKGARFVGKGVRLAGKAAPYADLALATYGAYKGWNAAATNEGVEEQMLNNSKNFGGEYLYAAGDDFKNGNYMKGIGHMAMGIGRGALASMDFLEHGKNIGMAGRLAYDTMVESYGQADKMKELSSQLSSLHASQAEKQGIKKDDYDAEVKRLMESEEGKQLRKYHEAQQKKDTGWLSDFMGNLISAGGHNRAGKAQVEDTVRMWAESQAKKNLSAQQQPSEQSAKDAETAIERQSEEVRQLVDRVNEEAVKDVAEQDVTSGTVDSYEDRVAGVAETMIDELTSGAIEQYNTPVKEMNAPVEPAQTYVQHGRGAYSGKSDTVAEKARDALSRIEAGVSGTSKAGGSSEQGSAPADNSMQGQGQDARGMQSGRINVEVHITMDTKLFNAEVVKVARENIQSILNKPGT